MDTPLLKVRLDLKSFCAMRRERRSVEQFGAAFIVEYLEAWKAINQQGGLPVMYQHASMFQAWKVGYLF